MNQNEKEYTKASLFRRAFAQCIDLLFILLCMFIFFCLSLIPLAQADAHYNEVTATMTEEEIAEFNAETSLDGLAYGAILIGGQMLAVVVILILQGILLLCRQQTVGKLVMNIRIKHQKYSWPWIPLIVLIRQALPFCFFLIPDYKEIVIGPFVFVANFIYMLGRERRCFHDHLLGTDVYIKE